VSAFVVAGGIVRNRAWILPRHLLAVAANRPNAFVYLTGDNTDSTETVLYNFDFYQGEDWRRHNVSVVKHDTGEPGYTRDGSDGPRYRSAHMAAERNLWASEALKRWPQATHLWVVDSDVLPEPDVLEKLLELEAPVAAAMVPLQDGKTPIAMIGWDSTARQARRTGEEAFLGKPHVATMVGGCYLIRASMCRATGAVDWPCGDLWGDHPQGEDGFFAEVFRDRGLPMLHHPGARCRHLMQRDDR